MNKKLLDKIIFLPYYGMVDKISTIPIFKGKNMKEKEISQEFAKAVYTLRIKPKLQKQPNGCIEWQGGKTKGYGQVYIKVNGSSSSYLTHRIVYVAFNGELSDGLLVRHTCDNPSCNNEDHLVSGTYFDNVQDCVERGRRSIRVGESHHMAHLTEKEVLEIRSRPAPATFHDGIMRFKRGYVLGLAEEFGISTATMSKILKGESWVHISTKINTVDESVIKIKKTDRIGKAGKGEDNPSAKLTKEKVLEIREAAKAGESKEVLASCYGVAKSTITAIISRRLWPSV